MEESCVLLYGRCGEEIKFVFYYWFKERCLEMNVLYCFFFKDLMWCNLDIVGFFVIIFILSVKRLLVFFKKGFFKFFIVVVKEFIFLKNEIWKFLCFI